ncbi:MAG: 2-oxoisovalerate dehydrogenase [Candidatus Sigynarchaeota archaeon]
MKEIIFIVEESPEGGYEARALEASIFTEADSLQELRESIKDAVRCHFDEKDAPRIIRLHFVKEEVIIA